MERGSEDDHKEGVWRGWENARDIRDQLISAAAPDHAVVGVSAGRAHRLVTTALKVAGWDTARTRDIVDPITHEAAHALLTRLNTCVREAVTAARQRAAAAYPEGFEPTTEDVQGLWAGTGIQPRNASPSHDLA